MSPPVWLDEWSECGPVQEPGLRCGPLSAAGRERARRLRETRRLEVDELRDGLRVRTRSYVGAVELDGVNLQVRPKIGAEVMPVFMRWALGLEAVSLLPTTESPIHTMGFVELVALLLLEETDRLFRAGLFQDYREADAWLAIPRGRLLFSELARQPHRSRLEAPCRFRRRTADVPVNRLLLASLSALRSAVGEYRLRLALHSREVELAEYCPLQPLSRALLVEARGALDRRNAYYEPVLRLAELILSASGPGFTGDEAEPLPGYLFDMNALFERFVARLLREYAPQHLRISAQPTTASAFRYGSNPLRWPLPRLRPDLVVYDLEGLPLMVLDTKYKLLAGRPPSPTDLYQLTLYSLSFGRKRSVPARIVYPRLGPDGPTPELKFYGFQEVGPRAHISLVGLDLPACASALLRRDRAALEAITACVLTVPAW